MKQNKYIAEILLAKTECNIYEGQGHDSEPQVPHVVHKTLRHQRN